MRLLPRPTPKAHLARRHRSEWMFRAMGLGAVLLACGILVTLLMMLAWRAVPGLTQTHWTLRFDQYAPASDQPEAIRADVMEKLELWLPGPNDSQTRRERLGLLSLAWMQEAREEMTQEPTFGAVGKLDLTMSDAVDRWKKMNPDERVARRHELRLTDRQIAWLKQLEAQNATGGTKLSTQFNWRFLRSGDSREPELASFGGAIAGSLWTLLICFLVSFPLAVCTAIYLEEFKPVGRLVDLIEVNINNLAAVPSIVFGLLGLALYLNLFGLPRSAPLVGGLTLALMILPTMIIATRAALKAVPPSIRDAARALGASELQVVLHHTFPLALPGVMTGTILGLARAIGETAPLLMIGMVAFVVDIPQKLTDPATAMPVQIYLWANNPEASFLDKTSAGILVLLIILGILNAVAITLRKRFEVRW